MGTLYHIHYSPWSEKARWALQHYQITYRSVEALPIFGEPIVRAKTGRWTGKITYPLFVTDQERVLGDSLAIARWADSAGAGESLFPAEHLDEILSWNALSDRALAAGRALTTLATAEDRDALVESIPPVFPRKLGPLSLKPLLGMLGDAGVAFLSYKYDFGSRDLERERKLLREALDELRNALPLNDGLEPPYLCGEQFTYADVAMALVLQFVKPVDQRYIALGKHSRRCWTRAALADEYEDLIVWRDALYDTHRAGFSLDKG